MDETKTYNRAPIADGEYYAKPRWHELALNEKSGNICLTVLWELCNADGTPGCFDLQTGAETPRPEGYEVWESVASTYVLAFAEEAENLKKCKGKPLDFIKDVCPKTYKSLSRVMTWCTAFDGVHLMWFTDYKERFYENIVRITVIHEEWNGKIRAKAKWTNPKERNVGGAVDEEAIAETRQKITSAFGGFFDVRESAPAPKAKNTPSGAPSASKAMPPPDSAKVTKADAWAEYCKHYNARDTAPWFATIKEIGGGKRESEFLSADWASVIETLIKNMPF